MTGKRQEVRLSVQSFRITERVQSPVNALLFDLFHSGSVSLGGRSIRLDNPALPVAVRKDDHVLWVFPEPVKVSTPGPDARLREVRQYRDRIEFSVRPWADVRIDFE
jgi:hypothetical protein